MPTSRLALIVLLLAAAGARGAVLERVCTTPGHDPRPVAVRIDTAAGTVVQDGLQLRNGVHAEHLPNLGYFVSTMDDSVTWGARNLAIGTTYYHYEMDTAANTFSYDAEGRTAHRGDLCPGRGGPPVTALRRATAPPLTAAQFLSRRPGNRQ